jgi:hypothetical protein
MKQDCGTFSKNWSFIKLINSVKSLKATDPQDFIFSLLDHPSAMLSPAGCTIIEPSYEREYLEVYTDFAIAWLLETHDLSILFAAEHENGIIVNTIPSWVPRWNISVATQALRLRTMLPFDASEETGSHRQSSRTDPTWRSVVLPLIR